MHLSSVDGTESMESIGDDFVNDAYLGATSLHTPDDNASFSQTMQLET